MVYIVICRTYQNGTMICTNIDSVWDTMGKAQEHAQFLRNLDEENGVTGDVYSIGTFEVQS